MMRGLQWPLQGCVISGIEAQIGLARADKMVRILLIAGLVFVLDQASKYLVVHLMNLKEVLSIAVFPPYVQFHMAWNQGVNFGLFSGESLILRWVLILLSIAISAWILRYGARLGHWRGAIFAGFVVGGAVGNVIDRLIYGAVADFLNLSCCGINNPFAFNLADIAIFVGAFGLVLFADKADNRT